MTQKNIKRNKTRLPVALRPFRSGIQKASYTKKPVAPQLKLL